LNLAGAPSRGATQFNRASMRRGANREVREARWNSQADVGAA
jgi:hypothetical protein